MMTMKMESQLTDTEKRIDAKTGKIQRMERELVRERESLERLEGLRKILLEQIGIDARLEVLKKIFDVDAYEYWEYRENVYCYNILIKAWKKMMFMKIEDLVSHTHMVKRVWLRDIHYYYDPSRMNFYMADGDIEMIGRGVCVKGDLFDTLNELRGKALA